MGVRRQEGHNDRVRALCHSEGPTAEVAIGERRCLRLLVETGWPRGLASSQTAVLLVGRQARLKQKTVINSQSQMEPPLQSRIEGCLFSLVAPSPSYIFFS